MSRFPRIKRTYFLTHFFGKLLVCGMYCPLLSNLPLIFRPLNYVLKLSTVAQTVTAGIFMAAIVTVHRYAVDCAWVTVSWTWTSALIACGHVVAKKQKRITSVTIFCTRHWPPTTCKINFVERRLAWYTFKCIVPSSKTLQLLLFGHPSL